MDTIADMTRDELHAFVDRVIQDREHRYRQLNSANEESLAAILARIKRNRLPAQPGVPSPTEILREERDQWYKI